MGVQLDIKTMTKTNLNNAIQEVLINPVYTENAKATQALVTDNMIEPKDQLFYWIKYIIHHKGAKHLLNGYVHSLSVVEFWSLDVYMFLLSIVILFCALNIVSCYGVIKFIWFITGKYSQKVKSE